MKAAGKQRFVSGPEPVVSVDGRSTEMCSVIPLLEREELGSPGFPRAKWYCLASRRQVSTESEPPEVKNALAMPSGLNHS